MIKNDRQYRLSRAQLQRLQALLEELRDRPLGEGGELRRSFETKAVAAQITELTGALDDYDALKEGRVPIEPVASLDQLPAALVRARIAAGLTQRELADRLGMPEQQIQRYEATEWASANLSRLIDVARVLGVSVAGDFGPPRNGIDIDDVLRQLARAGLERDFVRRRLLPRGTPETSEMGGAVPMLELVGRVSRVFGWAPSALLQGDDLSLPDDSLAAVSFKLPRRSDQSRVAAYTAYARYLGNLVLKATEHLPERPIPAEPVAFREAVIEQAGELTLESVIAFLWSVGVPVLPLSDPGGFHAVLLRSAGRNVIILKQGVRRERRWLFDLLHEVRHALEEPAVVNRAVIDLDSSGIGDASEHQANRFAGDVLLAGKAEELAAECVQVAHGRVEALKTVVPRIAIQGGVNVSDLANYMAYRLSLQNINWWGAASNLQGNGGDPWRIARDCFLLQAKLEGLPPLDRNLLGQALSEE
jgi:transcriptional regulator with XRE-family HTH domain